MWLLYQKMLEVFSFSYRDMIPVFQQELPTQHA